MFVLFFCLHLGIQFLVKLSTDLGLPEREHYENELKKVNKMKEIQRQVSRKTHRMMLIKLDVFSSRFRVLK